MCQQVQGQSLYKRIGEQATGRRGRVGFGKERKSELLYEGIALFIDFRKLEAGRESIFQRGPFDETRIERNSHVIERLVPDRADRLARRRDAKVSIAALGCDVLSACRDLLCGEAPRDGDVNFVKRIDVLEHAARHDMGTVHTYARPFGKLL